MAHFAKLDSNNVVLEVNVINNDDVGNLEFPESEPVGVAFLTEWSGGHSNWRQTSYNNSFRVRYAARGYQYNDEIDAFVPPRPFPSWVFDEEVYDWKAPVSQPSDGLNYTWDEGLQNWVIQE